ncbi:MAG: hypothetical protein Q7J27_09895 [Syntrophales bacterium]|nr:hypothetical protein [Syntrophales bacterium]
MEKVEEDLIARYIDQDEELKKFVEDHGKLEAILEDFNRRLHLTPEEEMEKKEIQKTKLRGKDKIFKILSQYREA